MLSIIIPTLNEENYLPFLLESIKKQSFKDYEIIIADAGSQDKTLDIAKQYGCKMAPGGLPAKGRNEGAKAAEGGSLLFLDADVVLPGIFLDKILKEFEQKNLEIATFCLSPAEKNKLYSFFLNFFYNLPITLLEKVLPHAAMGILIKKELFDKLNGFNENITLAEDHYLARRARKLGKYGIIRTAKIFVSIRRFKKEGWIRTYFKYLFCEFHMIFLGPVRSDIFKYKYGRYNKK